MYCDRAMLTNETSFIISTTEISTVTHQVNTYTGRSSCTWDFEKDCLIWKVCTAIFFLSWGRKSWGHTTLHRHSGNRYSGKPGTLRETRIVTHRRKLIKCKPRKGKEREAPEHVIAQSLRIFISTEHTVMCLSLQIDGVQSVLSFRHPKY